MLTLQAPLLVVEDSPEDFMVTVRALKKAGVAATIHRAADGDQALDFLHRRAEYADAPRPGIVLLDLNLPGTDGRDVLTAVKQDPDLKTIPVVILTTSSDLKDVEKCYLAGANSYLKKPVNLEAFMQSIQRLVDYWCDVVTLHR
jgi:CheY-like chemotaxis protein